MKDDSTLAERLFQTLVPRWRGCAACPLGSGSCDPVIGTGALDATYLFVFTDPAGSLHVGDEYLPSSEYDLFLDLLYGAGIQISDTFWTSIVAAPTPEGRSPRKEEFLACRPRLDEVIYAVDPRIVIPVGKFAMNRLMGGKWTSLDRCAGELGAIEVQGRLTTIEYDATPIHDPGHLLRSDQRDPRTGTWPPNGPVARTLKTLSMARDVVQFVTSKSRIEKARAHDKGAHDKGET